MQSIEVIITLACIAGFGILVLIGFLCLKKRFRLKWEHCCDYAFTCCGKYPSEKTEELRRQDERATSGRHQNGASVLQQQQPTYFGGRKRPEEIEPLATAVEGQQQMLATPGQPQYDDVDVEAGGNDDNMPIVQMYNPPSGRQSAGSTSRQQTSSSQQHYYASSTQRSYSGRPQTSRSDRDRDILVADDDEATL